MSYEKEGLSITIKLMRILVLRCPVAFMTTEIDNLSVESLEPRGEDTSSMFVVKKSKNESIGFELEKDGDIYFWEKKM